MEPPRVTVAQVRRVLSTLRARWSSVESGEGSAKCLCAPVPLDAERSIDPEQFALEFLLAQHSKKSARDGV
jgi:hypothetical protein